MGNAYTNITLVTQARDPPPLGYITIFGNRGYFALPFSCKDQHREQNHMAHSYVLYQVCTFGIVVALTQPLGFHQIVHNIYIGCLPSITNQCPLRGGRKQVTLLILIWEIAIGFVSHSPMNTMGIGIHMAVVWVLSQPPMC